MRRLLTAVDSGLFYVISGIISSIISGIIFHLSSFMSSIIYSSIIYIVGIPDVSAESGSMTSSSSVLTSP
jgi:hypothetical protein